MAPETTSCRRIPFRTNHKVALAVLCGLSALWAFVDFGGLRYRLDLDVYRIGAQRVLDGLELYSGGFHIIETIYLPFTYPPISALLFVPLAVVPYTVSSVLLTLCTVALTWWIVAQTLRAAGGFDRTSAGWLAVGLVAVLIHFSPIHTSINYGQINVVLMAMVFADAFVVPARYRGLLTGLAVSIKLTPAVFGLWFLLRRDWLSLVRMGLATVAATALAWLVLPRDSATYWFETLKETGRIGGEEYALNQSLNGLLYRLGLRAKVNTDDGLADQAMHGGTLWIALVVLALIVVTFVMVQLLRAGAPIAALCVNGFFALLASPVSWNHHWCWAPVLLIALACYVFAGDSASGLRGPRWMWVAVVSAGFLAFALEPTTFVPHNDHLELHWNIWQQVVGNAYLWWTLIALPLVSALAHKRQGPSNVA